MPNEGIRVVTTSKDDQYWQLGTANCYKISEFESLDDALLFRQLNK